MTDKHGPPIPGSAAGFLDKIAPGYWIPNRVAFDKKTWASLWSKEPMAVVQRGQDIVAVVWGVEGDEKDDLHNAAAMALAPRLIVEREARP